MILLNFSIFILFLLCNSAESNISVLWNWNVTEFNGEQQIETANFEDEITTNELSKMLFASSPPFDLSEVNDISPICKKQNQQYIEDLRKFELWALKMYDSSAKLPTGILNGNINQLGDFDMCLQVNSDEDQTLAIKGRYCLASIQIGINRANSKIATIHRLIHSHYHFKSHLDDPGHRVPRYSSVNWALCVPEECTASDIESGLKYHLNKILQFTNLEIQIKVDSAMCQSIKDSNEIPSSTIIAMCAFVAILTFQMIATLYDYYYADGGKNQWLLAFSWRKNLLSVCSLDRPSGDIQVIHGIRFLNAAMLVISHKSMAIFFIPYVNRTEMIEIISQPWSVICRAASLYTDPFIMISATLTSHSLFGKLNRFGRINICQEYISRLMRIIPPYAALIAFWTFILPWLNSGPLWNLVITHHSNVCKQTWWRNFLFIHNYFGFQKMCLTDTHHVGIDTQLFFLAPFLILLMWKCPKLGTILLIILALISTAMRYYITYTMHLSNYIHFGTSIKQLFNTADNMYILPPHRATVYIMGIILGYILRNRNTFALTRSQYRMGNTMSIVTFIISLFGPSFMGNLKYKYNPSDAAWYAAFAPILWCFSFAWIIFNAYTDHKGILNRIFSWKIYLITTKISYCFYLIQFPILFYNVGITRSAEHFGVFSKMANFKEYLWIIALAILMTVVFEMPFQNLRNLIYRKTRVENKPENVIINKKNM